MYPRVDENKVITVRCLHRLNLLISELKLALPVRISWQHLRFFILFLYYGSCLYQLSQSLGLSSHYIPPSIIYQKYPTIKYLLKIFRKLQNLSDKIWDKLKGKHRKEGVLCYFCEKRREKSKCCFSVGDPHLHQLSIEIITPVLPLSIVISEIIFPKRIGCILDRRRVFWDFNIFQSWLEVEEDLWNSSTLKWNSL